MSTLPGLVLVVALAVAAHTYAQLPLAPSEPSTPDAVRPRLLSTVDPEYPAIARAARITGTVALEAAIAPDGSVAQTRMVRSIPLLDPAATDAVSQWRFAPMADGETATVAVVVRFALDDLPAPPAREPIWVADTLPADFAFVHRCGLPIPARTIDTRSNTVEYLAGDPIHLGVTGAEKEQVYRLLYRGGFYGAHLPPGDRHDGDWDAVRPLPLTRIEVTADGVHVDVREEPPRLTMGQVRHELDFRANGTWVRLEWLADYSTKQGKQLREVGALIDRIAKQKDAVRRLPRRDRSCS